MSSRLEAVVLINAASPRVGDFFTRIAPYLDNFGIPYLTRDVRDAIPAEHLAAHPVIIIGHHDTGLAHPASADLYRAAHAADAGIVNFDTCAAPFALGAAVELLQPEALRFLNTTHYITRQHGSLESTPVNGRPQQQRPLLLPRLTLADYEVLVGEPDVPLLLTKRDPARQVHWTSYAWISHEVLGPLCAFADLIPRAIVWAARKPFVARRLPNFATLRVDDCVGDSGHYQQDPFGWVAACTRYEFKPWLGVFFDRISALSLEKLRQLAHRQQVTIGIHGEDLYGDYHCLSPAGVDQGAIADCIRAFATQHAIPLGKYVVPHAYDISTPALLALKSLGISMVGIPYDPDTGGGVLNERNPWMRLGPFRRHEPGCDGVPWNGEHGHASLYYADHFEAGGERFFNLLAEMRDVNGYEWFNYQDPQFQDVAGAVRNGTDILCRAFNYAVFANLFTHEDSWRGKFIAAIAPDDWQAMLAGIRSNIARFAPSFASLDDAADYVRNLRESAIDEASYRPARQELSIRFVGTTECATLLTVYRHFAGAIVEERISVPPYRDTHTAVHVLAERVWQQAEERLFTDEFPSDSEHDSQRCHGVRIAIDRAGSIHSLFRYCVPEMGGTQVFELWCAASGRHLGSRMFEVSPGSSGWQRFDLAEALSVEAGEYTLSVYGSVGPVPFVPYGFLFPVNKLFLRADVGAGVCGPRGAAPQQREQYRNYFLDIAFRPHGTAQ